MKTIIKKLLLIEKELSKSHGDFYLFALSLREDVEDRWDLIISADWIKEAEQVAVIREIASILNKKLSKDEIIKLSRVVVLEPNNPFLLALTKTFGGENIEISNSYINGIKIEHIHLIKSRYPNIRVKASNGKI